MLFWCCSSLSLLVVRCLLFVVSGSLSFAVVCYCVLVFVVVCCSLSGDVAIRCLLCVVWCALFIVGVVCCLLFGDWFVFWC